VTATWRQIAKEWLAKGYSHTEAADKLEEEFGHGAGFSRTTLTTLATTKLEPCPPEVAEFIHGWEIRDAKKWARHQRQVASQPPADAEPLPGSNSETIKEVMAKVGEGMRTWLDTDGHTLDDVKAKLDSTGAKLDDVKKTVNHTEAVTELLDAKMDTSEQRRQREHLRLMAAIFGMGLFLTCVSRPAPADPVQSFTVNVGQVAADVAGRQPARRWGEAIHPDNRIPAGIAGDMGERQPASGPVMMPHEPLAGQQVAPCSGSSEVIYGGCWYETGKKTPCPSDQFQEGQKCYVPIHAKEPKHSSETVRSPNPEQR